MFCSLVNTISKHHKPQLTTHVTTEEQPLTLTGVQAGSLTTREHEMTILCSTVTEGGFKAATADTRSC